MLGKQWPGYQVTEAVEGTLEREWLLRCLERLTDLQRQSVTLAYYDGYRRERLPANLLQAQRDYFGAHTYLRIDGTGTFHTDWIRARKL
jgi:6-phosphogluconate dehydrogenase